MLCCVVLCLRCVRSVYSVLVLCCVQSVLDSVLYQCFVVFNSTVLCCVVFKVCYECMCTVYCVVFKVC